MKKLLLTLLILPIFIFGQDYKKTTIHKNWKYLYEEEYKSFFLYSLEGELVDNKSEIPDFTIEIPKDDNGTIIVRLDGAYIYKYDSSPEDKNYISVEIIIDDSDIMNYEGRIAKIKGEEKTWTRVYLTRNDDSPKYGELFEKMRKGNTIYIRTTGSGDPIVYSYSLKGFTSGYNKLYNSWVSWNDQPQRNKNPFDYVPQSRE
tara:strand:+ start:280 stop:885 length:606 start_codon:yes stop_codon:yes gene_type:complete